MRVKWTGPFVVAIAVIGGLGASSEATPGPGEDECAAPDAVADAAEQRACGKELYESICAECHEEEDGSGTPLDPELLADYFTAQAVYEYVIFAMPEDDPGYLPEADYWAIVAYLLESRELLDETAILGPDTGEAIELSLGN